MSFPACRHAKKRRPQIAFLNWLGSDPFRIFFLSGILFSIAGVMLWVLFYQDQFPALKLAYHPGFSHARVMIQSFGGGFVIGFLGTAGTRLLSAPRLKPWELVPLFLLHIAGGICHLRGMLVWGDVIFLLTLGGFILCLAGRFFFFRKDLPPPPLFLAATGLLCGFFGTLLLSNPTWLKSSEMVRFANLLLNQGFLLGPVMGVGVFLFPRLLGGNFGGMSPGPSTRRSWRSMIAAAIALIVSFVVEAWGNAPTGLVLRGVAFIFVLSHVRWFGLKGQAIGTLANALRGLCMPLAILGIVLPAFFSRTLFPTRYVALEHFLFVGGFGLVILIAGSRVLFGHSGMVEHFGKRSWSARVIVILAVLATLTRVSADFLPRVTYSHYQYAAWAWALASALWLIWHSGRFFKKDEDDEEETPRVRLKKGEDTEVRVNLRRK